MVIVQRPVTFRMLVAVLAICAVMAGLAILLLPLAVAAAEVLPAPEAVGIGTQIWQQALPGIVTVVVALFGLVAVVIKVGGRALIEGHVKNVLLRSALMWLNEVVGSVVTKLEQTAGADLRKKAADGVITKEELEDGLKKLKAAALEEISALTIGRLLGAGLGEADAQKIIDARIEAEVPAAKATVAASKAGSKPAPSSGAVVDPLPRSAVG